MDLVGGWRALELNLETKSNGTEPSRRYLSVAVWGHTKTCTCGFFDNGSITTSMQAGEGALAPLRPMALYSAASGVHTPVVPEIARS